MPAPASVFAQLLNSGGTYLGGDNVGVCVGFEGARALRCPPLSISGAARAAGGWASGRGGTDVPAGLRRDRGLDWGFDVPLGISRRHRRVLDAGLNIRLVPCDLFAKSL